MAERFLSARQARPNPPLFPRKQTSPSDRPGAVQGAKRRSGPLTARTDLKSSRERGKGNCNGGGLHKGTVLQRSGPGRVFKGLGVAKRYCKTNVISDTFMQC